MKYDWRFPDWTKKSDKPRPEELRLLESIAAWLFSRDIPRDSLEMRLEQIVGGVFGVNSADVVVRAVVVDQKLTIIEVRNNG